ncbi:hypothetical protein [Pseudoruegeria sp. SK021]|uniref:hypothetical protein n=1 Tax=Pseudoruegeria sp. SK021 TaxID=1933035 RepID=UPI000A247202|nr:hypothetical protein [Pseudoruegeria sp. SK021]OSP56804.1 hypothetical protein BV911_02350 [Pseudoruegeria sp. SK021]
MALIADFLMIAGALGAALYCVVLSRRLSKFTNLEDGMGSAIAQMSVQVTEMTTTLDRAQGSAETSSRSLEDSTRRAEAAARRLEMLLASLHDLPEPSAGGSSKTAEKDPAKVAGPTFLRSARSDKRDEPAR